MGSSCLDCSPVRWDHRLNTGCVQCPWKLLHFSLDSFDHRNCKQILVDNSVELQNSINHLISLLFPRMCRVSLLPEKFPRPDKRSRVLEFPSNYIRPLVQLQWQISVASDPFGVGRIHYCFAGGPYCYLLLQISLS